MTRDAKKKDKTTGPLSIPQTPARSASLFQRNFDAISFLSRDKVPSNRRFSARSVRDIPAVRQFRDVLKEISENPDINPYEIAGELDLSSTAAREIVGTRRVFATSLRRVLREMLEEFHLTDKLQITSSDKGSRFFFVGKS
jgi:hypothetical protein